MLQVTLGLLVVIGLMLFLAWLAKRMRLVPGGSHHNALKVLAVLPLSNRERLLLVQVGEQQLLLGVTANQINCLHELDKPLDIASRQGQAGFSQLLNQWKKGGFSGNVNKDNKHEG
ncbi:flagellar protein FliO/FliZ [Marinospirillum celere]|uniref:Flagellar protein n=1 Tax=Marinospirillum celere TaxID=1122252 RepID=A0A1I1H8E8_9GAMM|nr:flagellar biosynthetic protein FliO [Marinospirillum celere]SFC17410.1 flagellar protein FliO/FliZ [Marinospirillum celere]